MDSSLIHTFASGLFTFILGIVWFFTRKLLMDFEKRIDTAEKKFEKNQEQIRVLEIAITRLKTIDELERGTGV